MSDNDSSAADRGSGFSAGLGAVETTARGFEVVKFADIYGAPCSLQASSLAVYEKPGTSAVWLGPDDAAPKVLASQAQSLGVETAERTGWVPYPIPPGVSLTTRMHLDRDQVAALIQHLQGWLDNDSFAAPNASLTGAQREPRRSTDEHDE
jgi:hypothetical protein